MLNKRDLALAAGLGAGVVAGQALVGEDLGLGNGQQFGAARGAQAYPLQPALLGQGGQ